MGTSSTDFPAGNNTYNPTVIGMPRTDSEANQRKANYMPLTTDRRHTVVANFVWQLPNADVSNSVAGRRDSRLAGVGCLPRRVRRALHGHLQHPRHLAIHADGNDSAWRARASSSPAIRDRATATIRISSSTRVPSRRRRRTATASSRAPTISTISRSTSSTSRSPASSGSAAIGGSSCASTPSTR